MAKRKKKKEETPEELVYKARVYWEDAHAKPEPLILKMEIDELLWNNLPGTANLFLADKLAITIYAQIQNIWNDEEKTNGDKKD